jgi:hypothetical protein
LGASTVVGPAGIGLLLGALDDEPHDDTSPAANRMMNTFLSLAITLPPPDLSEQDRCHAGEQGTSVFRRGAVLDFGKRLRGAKARAAARIASE